MSNKSPKPLSIAQRRARENRAVKIAEVLGFVGNVEYRHVYSQTGGAQYGRGSTESDDLLTIYAEAFERDADPSDFSLEAMIAHERGHQILAWHPRIAKLVAGIPSGSEEVLASLLGSLICDVEADRDTLYSKAAFDLVATGQKSEAVNRHLQSLRETLGALL